MDNQDIDTDINSYSLNELKEVFNITSDTYTIKVLNDKYNIKLQLNNSLLDADLQNRLNIFFNKIYQFLLLHSVDYHSQKDKNNLQLEYLNDKLDNLIYLNNNPKYLSNVLATNITNQSNIPINQNTYNKVKKQISINSDFRKKAPGLLNQSSTNFTIDLPEQFDNVISMHLVNIEIPNLIYTFSNTKNNNQFKITILNADDIYETHLITIPDGIWTISDLINYLQLNYFNREISDEDGYIINKYVRYLTFDIPDWDIRPLFRFKTQEEIQQYNTSIPIPVEPLNDASLNDLSYTLENINNSYGKEAKVSSHKQDLFKFSFLGCLGYNKSQLYKDNEAIIISYTNLDYTYNVNNNTYYGYVQANNIYEYSGEKELYICVNDYIGNQGQQILLLGTNTTLIADNILAKKTLKISPFKKNIYPLTQDYSIMREYYGGVRVRKLHIQIIDKYGTIVDLNDYPTNFVFEFTTLYSSEKLISFRNKM